LYVFVKFVHILVAIIAVGSSAGSSFWLRLAQRSPANLSFALRTTRFLEDFITLPGLFILLFTGLWMASTRWSRTLFWIRTGLTLVLLVILLVFLIVRFILSPLIKSVEGEGTQSPRAQRLELLFELFGGGGGLLLIVVVWLMVAKPG
jgi:uncharacterized membrane protein